MLKGITPQLCSMNSYLSSLLSEHGQLTWQGYLLNSQKNTFELLKLVRIVFNDLGEYLPKGILQEFERSCSLLKKYFKNRPKGEIDNEDHEKNYRMDYDEVQHYLDNKPEIPINDEERGELFKFLTMNEQKERNNQILLDSIPRYSFDFTNHLPTVQKAKSGFTNDFVRKESNSHETNKNVLKNSGSLHGQNSMNHENKRHFMEVSEKQVQTDLTLTVIKQIITCYAEANLGEQKAKETCDFATEMNDFIQEVRQTVARKSTKNKEKDKSLEKDGQTKEKKQKKSNLSQEKGGLSSGKKENLTAVVSKKDIRSSVIVPSQKIPEKDEINEQAQKAVSKAKPKQGKRQSTNSLISSSKKQIFREISNKKIASRVSRDLKESSKPLNNSKFSKQRRQISNHYEQNTITQTTQDLIVSQNYQETNNAQKIKEEEQIQKVGSNKMEEKDKIVEENKVEEINRESVSSSIEQSSENKELCEEKPSKKLSKKESVKSSRQKIPSNKEAVSHSNFLVQQAYSSTFGSSFYRKNSKKNQTIDNTSLPKIEEKATKLQKSEMAQSLKKRNFETSPYAKVVVQGQDSKTLKHNNSLSQFNNRSFHLNPIDSLFSPKDGNRSQFFQASQKGEGLRNLYSFRYEKDANPFLPQGERQIMFQEEHNKLVKEIQENTTTRRSKDPKWSKILKSIRHYELMHASLCGQNCIHLNKFYEFLKRKNLSMYINRKQLLLHKKNIEINTII